MRSLFIAALLLFTSQAQALTPEDMLARLKADAGGSASADRGRQLYLSRHSGGKAESCSTCHTDSPLQAGRHNRTSKAIEPLAPVANRERFTDPEKVEKWFKRNCNEVLGRACTAQEKADFTAYVLAQR
jgi:mono/diheme cytochrome c family protein